MTPTPRPWRARAAYAGWALGGVLAIVAIWVVVRDGRPGGPDLWALRTAVARRSSGLNSVVKLVSHLGAAIVIVPVTVVVGAWLVFRRNVRGAIMLAGSYLGALGLYDLIKAVVARPRPPVAERLISVTGWSFPSGHATQSVAFWGMLVVVLCGGRTRAVRTVGWVVAALVALAVGLSRIYLGVHWISDVTAGWLLGGAWLCTLAVIGTRSVRSDG